MHALLRVPVSANEVHWSQLAKQHGKRTEMVDAAKMAAAWVVNGNLSPAIQAKITAKAIPLTLSGKNLISFLKEMFFYLGIAVRYGAFPVMLILPTDDEEDGLFSMYVLRRHLSTPPGKLRELALSSRANDGFLSQMMIAAYMAVTGFPSMP